MLDPNEKVSKMRIHFQGGTLRSVLNSLVTGFDN